MDFAIVSKVMETLSALGFFTAVFLSIYFYLKFRNKERTMLIEKNVDISEFYKKRKGKKTSWNIIGFSILGFALGGLLALILTMLALVDKGGLGIMFFFVLCILGGALGLLIGYNKESKRNKELTNG